MRTLLGLMVGLGMLALVTSLWAAGDEEKIPLDQVPEKVIAAVKEKFPDGKLTGAEKEKENGEVFYEIALKDKDQKIEVLCKPDGTIVEIEKEIAAKDLPEAVTKAIEEKYPKATLKKAEEVFKKDKLEYYEVVLVTAKKKTVEVEVAPEGKILKEEVKEKKDQKKKDQ